MPRLPRAMVVDPVDVGVSLHQPVRAAGVFVRGGRGVGRPSSLQDEATRREKRWLQGSVSARQVFA